MYWNVINLVWGVFQVFIVALYDDRIPDLNYCLALPFLPASSARVAIRVGNASNFITLS